MRYLTVLIAALGLATLAYAHEEDEKSGTTYEKVSEGTKVIGWEGSEVEIKILLEPGNLAGSELEIGEITFPGGYEGSPHVHGVVEVFYPLEGDFEHWVEGTWYPVAKGGVATVRPGDQVIHRCASETPCKLLVIWGPGGEIERMAPSIVKALTE